MEGGERFENYEWLASSGEQLGRYSGKWVAISGKRVVASADSMKELLANPSVRKEMRPFITKIPLPEESVASLSLGA